ncbi:hypothetical protein BESB_022710 [Besnoitia besnoiti]|uniref:NADP-dependent oxidoreductase domain-containing protein n=1 Tax=Besnoitia besnoiti TaxID=94643 RepID=A0A2A9M1D2_BESBE|nr:hypothetical protein BESB_022710 [Besnoitia besnoiti]PFH31779.1 hypothetical protein BESB_022710 [Besnoitia besnoiti]
MKISWLPRHLVAAASFQEIHLLPSSRGSAFQFVDIDASLSPCCSGSGAAAATLRFQIESGGRPRAPQSEARPSRRRRRRSSSLFPLFLFLFFPIVFSIMSLLVSPALVAECRSSRAPPAAVDTKLLRAATGDTQWRGFSFPLSGLSLHADRGYENTHGLASRLPQQRRPPPRVPRRRQRRRGEPFSGAPFAEEASTDHTRELRSSLRKACSTVLSALSRFRGVRTARSPRSPLSASLSSRRLPVSFLFLTSSCSACSYAPSSLCLSPYSLFCSLEPSAPSPPRGPSFLLGRSFRLSSALRSLFHSSRTPSLPGSFASPSTAPSAACAAPASHCCLCQSSLSSRLSSPSISPSPLAPLAPSTFRLPSRGLPSWQSASTLSSTSPSRPPPSSAPSLSLAEAEAVRTESAERDSVRAAVAEREKLLSSPPSLLSSLDRVRELTGRHSTAEPIAFSASGDVKRMSSARRDAKPTSVVDSAALRETTASVVAPPSSERRSKETGRVSALSPEATGWQVLPDTEWRSYSREQFFHENNTANYEAFPETLPLALTSSKLKHLQSRQREVYQTRKATERRPGAKSWRDYLSWLPEERREDDEGFPPPPDSNIEELPIKTLVVDNETILYRQACAESPMIIDEETFERLKSKWQNRTELQRVQREEKALYDVPEEFPDADWVPLKPSLPMGRLVVDYGLVPNITLTAGGYDYIETYHDPKRNYTWSYKRWNPFKQEGELPGSRDNETGSSFDLETEQSRRYWGEEAMPPAKELDDGVFRQVTLAEEMTRGTKRTPVGMDQWQFTPVHPLGHVAQDQNFCLSALNRTLPQAREEARREAASAAALAELYARAAADGRADLVAGKGTLPLWIPLPKPGAAASTSSSSPALRGRCNLSVPEGDVRSGEDSAPSQGSAASRISRSPARLPPDSPSSDPPAGPSAVRRSAYQPLAEADIAAGERPDGMKYRQLGKSELFVSEVGLGTMTVGSPQLGRERAFQLFDYAVDSWGVNFIDTAELYPLPAVPLTYGRSEEIIGDWLAKRGPKKREELVIATKVAGRAPTTLDQTGTCLSKRQIIAAAEGSLKRLKTDYIDLFQLHWPDRYVPLQSSGDFGDVLFDPERAREQDRRDEVVPMEEQLEAISQLLREGKIRAWGLSNETPYGVCRFTDLATRVFGLPPPASVQVHYNLLCRNDVEKGFVELARPQNAGTALVAYGAFGGGILTGKYLEWLEYPTTGRMLRFPSYMKRYRGSLAARAVTAYFYLALRLNHPNLTVMALRWVLSRPFICSTVLGFTDFLQLRENLFCTTPACGALSDWAEREINFLHWKWRDALRIIQ